MRFLFPFSKKTSSGFTLIEVLVAVTVIITVVFAPISIVSEYLSRNTLTTEHVQASLLAQEVVEFVRCSRDSRLLSGGFDWFSNIYTKGSGESGASGGSCLGVDYSACVIGLEEWLSSDGRPETFCTVEYVDGYVSGVSSSLSRRGREPATCDGGVATTSLSATLSLVIPDPTVSETDFVLVAPCVSWAGERAIVRIDYVREVLFGWLVRAFN